MNAFRFAHPEWILPLAAALLGLGVALGVGAWVSRRRRTRLLGERGGRVVRPALRSDAALLLAAAALALALLGPRIGERVVRVPASGIDVVFCLDVSRSMDARDVPPSRLARAGRAVGELLARLAPEDRAALSAFAGVGVLLTPLTPDREVLAELVSGIDTELVSPASSDLAAGVRAALGAFEAGSERPRLLVVLSDGEDPERHSDLGAADALRAGVRVLSIGIGSETGATLPDHGVLLVDRSGRTVVSRRNLERLGALAAATGGEVFAADVWGQLDYDAAARAIRRDASSAAGSLVERKVQAVRVLPFAGLAFLILLLEGLPRRLLRVPPGTWCLRPAWRRAALPLAASLVLLPVAASPADDASLASLEARVRAQPDDPAALIALGAARLERGRRDAAVRAFLAAAVRAREPHAAAIAHFDLGVAQLERGDLEAAREAFLDALAFDPRDEKARFNLEWTLVSLEQRPPPAPSEPDPPPEEPPAPVPSSPSPEREAAERPDEPTPSPQLSDAQQQRLLERVEEDPGHALRAAAREARRTGAGVPVW